ncbi:MAG: molybdenum cofactor biosynthesis protein MoaE [Acidobacteriales bacterium]|nr:molybdenum cofactor biosynthesis protein MoaE [Terriglobales bacterium]
MPKWRGSARTAWAFRYAYDVQVRVLFFGLLTDIIGRRSDMLSLPQGATVLDLLAHYQSNFPRLNGLVSSLAISINQSYAPVTSVLHEGDEVALLPPVSGGLGSTPLVRIVRERIVPEEIVPRLERPEDGAVVVFDGIVRNHSRGRATLYLDYDAYEEMALKQMHSLAEEALRKFQIRNLALVHRLGRLQIGESSVFIAVVSAHRAPAFEACRWLIDTLKRTVPIWKKEYFEDGAVWADGEPFPAEISAQRGQSG